MTSVDFRLKMTVRRKGVRSKRGLGDPIAIEVVGSCSGDAHIQHESIYSHVKGRWSNEGLNVGARLGRKQWTHWVHAYIFDGQGLPSYPKTTTQPWLRCSTRISVTTRNSTDVQSANRPTLVRRTANE